MSSRYVDSLFRVVSTSVNKLDLQSVLTNIASATAAASAAPLDHFYARIGALNGPFFPCGWGNLSVVNYEEDLRHLIQGPPSSVKLSWRLIERGNRDGVDYLLYEGTFRTPCLQRVYDALPPESRTGRVQLLMPAHLQTFQPFHPGLAADPRYPDAQLQPSATLPYPGGDSRRLRQPPLAVSADGPACVIHLAATGDQTFGRRLGLGFPLLKDNVCSLVLESPFYGARRPAAQRGSKLLRVSDLLTLGWATIAESINLLHWLREEGYGPLGMCGLSMGGVHASMTAGLYPGDVAVTPLLAPRSAAVAYCDGAMRAVMAWEPLLKEVDENNNHIPQVLMAAGRPVTVEVPVPGPAGLGAASVQSVSLIREATYALGDLELWGERQHLAAGAAAAATAGSGDGDSDGDVLALPVRNTSAAAGGRSAVATTALQEQREARARYGEAAAAEEGLAAVVAVVEGGGTAGPGGEVGGRAGVSSGGAGGGRGVESGGRSSGGAGGGGLGTGVLKGLPFVSVMDIYDRLAGMALRVAGGEGSSDAGGGGDGRGVRDAAAHAARTAGRSSSSQEPSGPFSGVISDPRLNGLHQHHHQQQTHQQHQHDGQHPAVPCDPPSSSRRADTGAAAVAGQAVAPVPTSSSANHHHYQQQQPRQQWQHTNPWVTRPQPQPHAPDMPFPRAASSTTTTGTTTGTTTSTTTSTTTGTSTGTASAAPVADTASLDHAAAAAAANVPVLAGDTAGGSGGGTVMGRQLLGDLGRAMRALRASDRGMEHPSTVLRLKSVLETYTDITRYPRPRRTDAAVIVAALDDAYVSRESVQQLHRYWPGSELRMVTGGHVSAFLMHQEAFRGAIRDSLSRVVRPPPQQQ